MNDLRKMKRKQTDAYLYVYDRNNEDFIGCVVDMSTGGVKLRCVVEMEIDAIFQFKILLPMNIDGNMDIAFDAKCVWCEKCDDSDEFQIGFRLQNVSEEEKRRIDMLLNHPLFIDASELVNVTISKK